LTLQALKDMKHTKTKRNQWEDHYARKARKEKYPARSVYKLQEIQDKHRLIRKGARILDLGCYPGSWLVYAADLTGPGGSVTGIDLKTVTVKLPPHVRIYTGDILALDDSLSKSIGDGFDIVLSDMAPATTGNKNVDAARSFNLCEAALNIAAGRLVTGGSFVCKIFQGPDFNSFINMVKVLFENCKIIKPQSSRKASREIFIIGLHKRQEEACQDTINGRQSNTKRELQTPEGGKSLQN